MNTATEKKRILTGMYCTPELHDKLRRLSQKTMIPIATMARSALIEKYAEQLKQVEAEISREKAELQNEKASTV